MKKQKNQQSETLRERAARSFEISREVILDAARITFLGNRELTVENYKSIAEYTENKIVLETNPHRLTVAGTQLEIKSIARELLYITGRIHTVEFKQEV